MKRSMIAAFRLQHRNDSARDFLPGQVLQIDAEAVLVKAVGYPVPFRFNLRDFRGPKPVVGDRVCYESWIDFIGGGWSIEVVA